jgi:hypothetical protein
LFQATFPDFDVKISDYRSPRLALYEYLKRFKILTGAPLFYYKRSRMWDKFLVENLDLDADYPHFAGPKRAQRYLADQCDALMVGMDVWCIVRGTQRPQFPNIYWLPEEMEIPKIAYGVSGYNSDLSLLQRHENEISRYINGFNIIGSRDRFTHEMVLKYRTRPDGLIARIPDPTFLFEIPQTGVAHQLASIGIDLDRPILGLLLSGNDRLSQEIQSFYRAKGYQILALSMYNPFADYNLGHLLTPFEWAEAFRLCTFCFTDRFHGAVFCLKNQIPFIGLEFDRHLPRGQSKLHDLLAEFDLLACYENPADENFEIAEFLSHSEAIEAIWEKELKRRVAPKLHSTITEHQEFIRKMKALLAW